MPFLFTPTPLKRSRSQFAAMNTPNGFVSEFSTLFSPYRQYIIKGGPGTGKSTLMKKIAEKGEASGCTVTRCYCSSDSDSLDGVIVKELSLAVIDGTAPHAAEPELFGAKDNYLSLSPFVDSARLKESIPALTALKSKKSIAYRHAYSLLSAIKQTDACFDEARTAAFSKEKCEKALSHLLDRFAIKETTPAVIRHTPISAIGQNGYTLLTSLREEATTVIFVSDRFGVAPHLFDVLKTLLQKRAVSYRYSLSPLTLAPDTVFLEERKLLITSLPFTDTPDGTILCERFLDNRGKYLLKGKGALVKLEKHLFEEAIKAFEEAGSAHRESEALYADAMDFSALNAYTDELLYKFFT